MANILSDERRAQIIGCICEGMSIRATARLTGTSKTTVTKLILAMGDACIRYQDHAFRGLDSEFVESDEIWSFCGSKDRNVPVGEEDNPDYGSVWTWTAIDADSKLVITWSVGDRSSDSAEGFLTDLAGRLNNRIQLSTDGWGAYEHTVRIVFGMRDGVDWGAVIKKFGGGDHEHRYSPDAVTAIEKKRKFGDPDMSRVSTSYVERNNLNIRMGSRRYTRLTNAFSKRVENHAAATALHFAYYNLVRPHGTLTKKYGTKTTPAMAASVESQPWSVTDLVELLDRYAV